MDQSDRDMIVQIDRKLDLIKNDIHRLQLTQARIEVDLEYHIKRTDALEKKVMETSKVIGPLQAMSLSWGFMVKLSTLLAGIATVIMLMFKIIYRSF